MKTADAERAVHAIALTNGHRSIKGLSGLDMIEFSFYEGVGFFDAICY